MRRRTYRRSFGFGASVLALALLAACSSPANSSAPTTSKTAAPATTSASVPSFAQPYPFGTVQAKAPPVVNGKAPVIRRIATDKPYVFLTIDDGQVRAQEALELMRQAGVQPTLFLNEMYVKGHEDYFKQLQDQAHAVIGNHTVNHPNLKKLAYADQRKEICADSDDFQKAFGQRPTLFRPPFGNYNDDTLRAAADCGLKAVVLWTAAVNNGVVQFQSGKKLQQGDIVLMHFRKTFVKDFSAFLQRAKQDGLTPVPLVDFLA